MYNPKDFLSLSLISTAALLCLVFISVYSLLVTPLEGAEGGQQLAGAILGILAAVYLIHALGKAVPPSKDVLDPNSKDRDHRRLLRALRSVCQKAGIPAPRVVVRREGRPNICSYGFGPQWCCIYANQELLNVVSDEAELQAVLAHEVAHIKRFDTFFFSCINPPLRLVSRLLSFLLALLSGTSRQGKRAFSPLLWIVALRGGGGKGMLGGCLLLLFMMMCLVYVLSYALFAVAFLTGAVMASLIYVRYIEKRADLEGAELVGDPDLMLLAMARSLDHYPAELAAVDRYATVALGNAQYALDDVVRTLKQGGDATSGTDWVQRLFRSHPPVVQRMSYIVQKFGSNLA